MHTVVAMGLLAVVAALAPVTLGRYDLTDHEVWLLSGAVALVGLLVMIVVSARTPEYRTGWATATRGRRLRPGDVSRGLAYAVYTIALVVSPIVMVLGVAPDLEAALYFTYVVVILLGAGWALLYLVYSQRCPASA
jgi:hypothetical protein